MSNPNTVCSEMVKRGRFFPVCLYVVKHPILWGLSWQGPRPARGRRRAGSIFGKHVFNHTLLNCNKMESCCDRKPCLLRLELAHISFATALTKSFRDLSRLVNIDGSIVVHCTVTRDNSDTLQSESGRLGRHVLPKEYQLQC